MAYKRMPWQDRVVERPRTFTETINPDGSKTLTPAPGVIVQEGTPVNAAQLLRMEQGIWEALFSSSDLPWDGISRTATKDPVTGDITQSNEVIVATGKLLRRRTYTYTGYNLSGINIKVYDDDGATVIGEASDAISYDVNDDWTGTERQVIIW